MQKLVDKVYKPKQMDKIRKVSRFEFEQRDVRNKLDVADIYLQLGQITDALEAKGIVLATNANNEEDMIQMVIEDRRAVSGDLTQLEYFRRQTALEKGSLIEKARKLFFGAAVSPEEELANKEIKLTVEPDPAQEAKLSAIIGSISKLTENLLKPTEEPAPKKEVAESAVSEKPVAGEKGFVDKKAEGSVNIQPAI